MSGSANPMRLAVFIMPMEDRWRTEGMRDVTCLRLHLSGFSDFRVLVVNQEPRNKSGVLPSVRSQYLEQMKQDDDISAPSLCKGIRRKSFFLGEKPFSSPPKPCSPPEQCLEGSSSTGL